MNKAKPKTAKPFDISKWVVWDAYERVRANQGGPKRSTRRWPSNTRHWRRTTGYGTGSSRSQKRLPRLWTGSVLLTAKSFSAS